MEEHLEEGNGYVEAGSGTPVMMLPGMEGSKWFWRYQLEGLRARYRIIACDLPVRRPSLSSRMSDYADEVLRTMDMLGLERVVVAGESFGGMVAQELVTTHPQRVLALVLCNTMDRPRRGGFGLNMFTLATLIHQLAFLPFLTDRGRIRLLGWVGRHRGFVMDPSPGNLDLTRYILRYGTACGFGGYLDRMIAAGKISYADRLEDIGVPTLVLRGAEDRLVDADTALRYVSWIPGARVALIPGGGHCCQHTVPHATNRALDDFLTEAGF